MHPSLVRSLRHAATAASLAIALTNCSDPSSYGTSVEAVTQCPGASTLLGVDVSNGNGPIDWTAAHGAGIAFTYMKATQGTGFIDARFATNWANARAAGVRRGAYHFFDPTVDGVTQARHYLAVIGTLQAGDLPPALDVECPDGDAMCLGYSGGSGIAPAADIRTRMIDWLTTVQAATGRAPVIYTFPSYFTSNGIDTTGLEQYPLWLANISTSDCFNVISPWTHAPIRQYSWTGTVAGISGGVDMDRFYGTLVDLDAFAAGGYAYAAQYVDQSWPFASTGPIRMRPGEHVTAWIQMRNVGTATWDSNTRLATTMPRDRTSPFVGPDWVGPDRLASVTGTVPPGGTFRFQFTLVAPMSTGTYDEHWGFVQERTAWFGDQGGPADGVVEAIIEVAGEPVVFDAGVGDASVTDAGSDAYRAEGGVGAEGPMSAPGCGCAVAEASSHSTRAWAIGVIAIVALARRRKHKYTNAPRLSRTARRRCFRSGS